ncbi:ATP-dependent Clp protease adapter ClpS [Intrasporangium sp. DVR]
MSLAPVAPVRSPETEEATETDEVVAPDLPWVTIVWNDPVNLMSYVTWVFESYFGYPRPKAEKLMMDVHTKGRAVVSSGPRESMERDAESLQGYGLWATFEKDE